MDDHKLVKFFLLLLLLPVILAMCSGDRFRYPCQDPANWDKDMCKAPVCDVTRTCPEQIFKGQRDPRLGAPVNGQNQTNFATPMATPVAPQGANCGK